MGNRGDDGRVPNMYNYSRATAPSSRISCSRFFHPLPICLCFFSLSFPRLPRSYYFAESFTPGCLLQVALPQTEPPDSPPKQNYRHSLYTLPLCLGTNQHHRVTVEAQVSTRRQTRRFPSLSLSLSISLSVAIKRPEKCPSANKIVSRASPVCSSDLKVGT